MLLKVLKNPRELRSMVLFVGQSEVSRANFTSSNTGLSKTLFLALLSSTVFCYISKIITSLSRICNFENGLFSQTTIDCRVLYYCIIGM